MGEPNSSRARKIADTIFVCGCVVGLLMLLAFPVRQVHRFAEHYRGAEACRMVKRHTFIAESDSSQSRNVIVPQLYRVGSLPPRLANSVKPLANYDIFVPAPLTHLLMRMKRGGRHSQADPLL